MTMPEPATASPGAARALSPADWVHAATALLVEGGVDSVRVDALARGLGVTRGSFYWHFRDREELLRALLKAWRDSATDQLIERFEHRGGDPRERIRELLSLPFRGRSARRAAGVELAIRAWARRDAAARQAVDEVDERRIGYVAQCFSALGFEIAEARHRAFMLYAYELTESLLGQPGTPAQQARRRAFAETLLLQPVPAGPAPPMP